MSASLRTDLVLDTFESAICARGGTLDGLGRHRNLGTKYLSIRYIERLAETGIEPSVGSVDDPHDNAFANALAGSLMASSRRR